MTSLRKWNEHEGSLCESKEGFDVIDCQCCGFKHIIPLPMPKELEEVYRHEYYSQDKPLYLERTREDKPWSDLVYRERYELFENLLPIHCRRLLDIGSGPGFFLRLGAERGWIVKGVEPSRQSAMHSREMGLDILEDFLCEQTVEALGRYDVVHMSHVLEHIPDPKGFLGLVEDVLRPEGLLCLIVPNDFSPVQQALQKACDYAPWWVAPPHHINYFNFDSLEGLLSRCGFEVLHRETSFPIDLFLLMGENYVGNDALGRVCHERRKRLEMNLDKAGMGHVKKDLYKAFAEVGIGRDVILVARKRSDLSA